MEYFIIVYIGFLGLYLGSFYNVIGIRIPKNETIMGRSHCMSCQKQLNHFELIPIIGYIAVKGKCSSCKKRISPFYPIMEFITAVLFVVSYIFLKDSMVEYIVMVLFISLMVIVTVSDIYYKIVPDILLLIFGIPIFVLRLFFTDMLWYDAVIGAVLGFGFMYVIALYGKVRFKKDALGGGDIKLYFIIGLVLGYNYVILSLFFASVAGIIFSATKMKKGDYLPFVPFIFIGSLIAYFLGETIVNWYIGILF